MTCLQVLAASAAKMNIPVTLRVQLHHVLAFWRLRQHFRNPWLVADLRLGLRGSVEAHICLFLGRSRVGLSTDLFLVREVFCSEPELDSFRFLRFNLGSNGCG